MFRLTPAIVLLLSSTPVYSNGAISPNSAIKPELIVMPDQMCVQYINQYQTATKVVEIVDLAGYSIQFTFDRGFAFDPDTAYITDMPKSLTVDKQSITLAENDSGTFCFEIYPGF